MDQDRLTEKSLEALQTAQRLAAKFNHQQMDVEHLVIALLDQEHGLAASILAKAEVSVDAVKIKLQREVEKVPRVTGGSANQIGITSRLNRLLGQADDEAKKMKDDFVSVEHLLIGDDSKTAGPTGPHPQGSSAANRARLMAKALQQVRGQSAGHDSESRSDV